MCKKRPGEAKKIHSELSKNPVFQAHVPKIVKNGAFTNVLKSFWSQIIPTGNPAVLGTECQLWSLQRWPLGIHQGGASEGREWPGGGGAQATDAILGTP